MYELLYSLQNLQEMLSVLGPSRNWEDTRAGPAGWLARSLTPHQLTHSLLHTAEGHPAALNVGGASLKQVATSVSHHHATNHGMLLPAWLELSGPWYRPTHKTKLHQHFIFRIYRNITCIVWQHDFYLINKYKFLKYHRYTYMLSWCPFCPSTPTSAKTVTSGDM